VASSSQQGNESQVHKTLTASSLDAEILRPLLHGVGRSVGRSVSQSVSQSVS
jgi:hypothetical protein